MLFNWFIFLSNEIKNHFQMSAGKFTISIKNGSVISLLSECSLLIFQGKILILIPFSRG